MLPSIFTGPKINILSPRHFIFPIVPSPEIFKLLSEITLLIFDLPLSSIFEEMAVPIKAESDVNIYFDLTV